MCSRLEKTGLGVMVREPRSKRGGLTSEPPRKTTPWPQVGQTSRQKAREALETRTETPILPKSSFS